MSGTRRRIGGVSAVLAAVAIGLAPAPASAGAAGAVATGPVTSLPLPRYVSLNAAEINVRRGPGLDYRRDWVYRRRGLPVRVIDEWGHWRRIEDRSGEGGWVYHALISGRRTAVVTVEGVLLRRAPAEDDGIGPCAAGRAPGAVACAEEGVVARLEACRPWWCRISTAGHSGWVPKSAIWGVAEGETFGG